MIEEFIEECCVYDIHSKLSSTELYRAYCLWCSTRKRFAMSHAAFGSAIRRCPFVSVVKASVTRYCGLRLTGSVPEKVLYVSWEQELPRAISILRQTKNLYDGISVLDIFEALGVVHSRDTLQYVAQLLASRGWTRGHRYQVRNDDHRVKLWFPKACVDQGPVVTKTVVETSAKDDRVDFLMAAFVTISKKLKNGESLEETMIKIGEYLEKMQ